MGDFPGYQGGLFAALKNVSATLLASIRTRLELLGNEIQEEKVRIVQVLVMALCLAFCLGVGVLVLILFLTAVFWENRILVLGISCGALLAVGILLAIAVKQALSRPKRIFDASLSELEEDLQQLKASLGKASLVPRDAPAE